MGRQHARAQDPHCAGVICHELHESKSIIYGGFLYFVLLLVLWVILYLALQNNEDLPLHNVMWSGAIVSIGSFIIRAIEIERNGIVQGMLSDQHMWIFPLITVLIAAIVWMTKGDV